MKNTKVEIEVDPKYGKMFTIWKVLGVTSEGKEILAERPEVKFGVRKAEKHLSLFDHREELEKFVEDNM
tara:strand:- start:688 stop:894 length:207 start_codon:yes stop_codon:yes gene_type:complete